MFDTISNLDFHKRQCKKIKKINNPLGLTLMQIQHQYAKDLHFKNWKHLIDFCNQIKILEENKNDKK